jgi:mercuric ion transport protein
MKQILKFGIAGTIIIAICCFTPLLVVILGALGLSAWVAGLDQILFPLLAFFAAITLFAFLRLRGAK